MDYANSITYGMSASNMHRLQSVQNSLTRVVLPSLRHLSPSERLSYLHWLPVHYRIQFKIATLACNTLATCQPSYLYNLLHVYHPSRALRSSTQQLLHVPYMSTDSATALLQHGTPFLSQLKTEGSDNYHSSVGGEGCSNVKRDHCTTGLRCVVQR